MIMEHTTRHDGRYSGTLHYIQTHWPSYVFFFGGSALLILLAIVFSAQRGWSGFIAVGLIAFLMSCALLIASLRAAHNIYDNDKIRDALIELGQIRPDELVVVVNLGTRRLPERLSRRLTTGKVIVIDIYNPQQTPGKALARAHKWTAARRTSGHQEDHYQSDPRISWRDGSVGLLPLPDNSVPVVMLIQTVSEFWQQGDRICLIREVERILAPGGRLLLAERLRTRTNLLVMGPDALQLEPLQYWQELLGETKLQLEGIKNLEELIYFIRADKQWGELGRQLTLDF
jgi:ubiquinone/menaquinone biosynthesis C-methylase UbiE